jgi:hypothetical protein
VPWAAALLVPADLSMGALLTGDAVLWSGRRAGLSTASTGLLYDHLHPSIDVAVAVFVLGHVVGTVVLGLALLRSRTIRPPFAWALTISQPLHLVAFLVLGVQALDVAAWTLTTVGMAAAAVARWSGAPGGREWWCREQRAPTAPGVTMAVLLPGGRPGHAGGHGRARVTG